MLLAVTYLEGAIQCCIIRFRHGQVDRMASTPQNIGLSGVKVSVVGHIAARLGGYQGAEQNILRCTALVLGQDMLETKQVSDYSLQGVEAAATCKPTDDEQSIQHTSDTLGVLLKQIDHHWEARALAEQHLW